MPKFTNELVLTRSPQQVFDFLRTTENRVRLLPPDAGMEWVSGPQILELGSRTTLKLRRYGLSQSIVQEVTACDPPTRMVEEQCQGPLRRWVLTTTCTPCPEGTRLQDVVEFEPPGGMLGLLVTSAKISATLAESFAWRDRQLRALLES